MFFIAFFDVSRAQFVFVHKMVERGEKSGEA